MRKLFTVLCLWGGIALGAYAQRFEGKEIYVPKDLRSMNLEDAESEWSYQRMVLTPNFAIFWQKGFGESLSNPPALEGQDMSVDLENLKARLERFYAFYRDTLRFIRSGSNAERYRMMVMINYSLEGTAYGGDYDGVIGAFWAAPNRLKDKALNCVAHELGHSFQSQAGIDVRTALGIAPITLDSLEAAQREAEEPNRPKGDTPAPGDKPKPGDLPGIGGGGIYEMAAQWMLWHVNPYWVRDELYHWDAYRRQPHRAFLSWANVYHAPYVLEGWSQKHGLTIMSRIFREGFHREDPVDAYKRLTGISQSAFCDETFETNRHTVWLDFRHAYAETRPYVGDRPNHPDFAARMVTEKKDTVTLVTTAQSGWLQPVADEMPENYGFNVIPIDINGVKEVSVRFVGDTKQKGSGWRYGFVAVDANGRCSYPPMQSAAKGSLSFMPQGYKRLYLVVMGAPAEHSHVGFGDKAETPVHKYRVKVKIKK